MNQNELCRYRQKPLPLHANSKYTYMQTSSSFPLSLIRCMLAVVFVILGFLHLTSCGKTQSREETQGMPAETYQHFEDHGGATVPLSIIDTSRPQGLSVRAVVKQ